MMNDIITVKCKNGRRIININDIIYCQAKNNYTDMFLTSLEGNRINCAKTLNEFEKMLPKDLFVRCHRSYLANIKHIYILQFKDKKITLINEKTIKLSQNGYKNVKKILNF